jgi:hypothetical protein
MDSEDKWVQDADRVNLFRKIFRRSSISDEQKVQGMYVPAEKMGSILTQMGQSFDENELQKEVGRAAPSGKVDFNTYTSIASRFVTKPGAITKAATEPFAFKNLAKLNDFSDY